MQSKEAKLNKEQEEIWRNGVKEILSHEDLQLMWAKSGEVIEYPRDQQPPILKKSNGSTASYYELPEGAKELQDLISYKNMNGQLAEIFRACYRYGEVSHSPTIRDIKKIIFYAQEELKRIEKYT